jgi:hypothetical protein
VIRISPPWIACPDLAGGKGWVNKRQKTDEYPKWGLFQKNAPLYYAEKGIGSKV